MRHSPSSGKHYPLKTNPFVVLISVFYASYIFTSPSSNIVIYFALEHWLVLNKLFWIIIIMGTSFAPSRTLNVICFISSAASIVPPACWNILSDLWLVALNGSESNLYFPHSNTYGWPQLDDTPASTMAVLTFFFGLSILAPLPLFLRCLPCLLLRKYVLGLIATLMVMGSG